MSQIRLSGAAIEKNGSFVTERSDTVQGDQGERAGGTEFWLRESQRAARIGSYELDIAEGTWRCTEVLDEIFGIDDTYPKTVDSWAALVHPEEQDEMTRYFMEQVLGQRLPFERDYRIVRRSDGQERWVFGRGELTVNENGDPVSMVGTIQDITERKVAELAFERGEAKFRALFEAGAEAFVLVGPDGTIERVNRRAEAVFGYQQGELEGQPLNVLVPEVFRASHTKRVRDFVENPSARPLRAGLELQARRKDGTTFPAEISLSYVATDSGTVAMAAVSDETERKRAEDKLRESVERLRKSDAERGRLLASLVVAQEEERGRMARELHDDAIQVMTAAELRLQTLAIKDPSSAEMLNTLGETIRSAIGRLRTSLIGLRPPILENLGVAPALRAHMEAMKEQRGPDFTIEDLWERQPGIETRVTVYRIVLESVNNVRKHADARSVSVTLEHLEGGFGAVVHDDGKGFDPSAAVEGAPGHMGLTVMRERAELAGGHLEILSSPGEGTTVRFWVPDVPDQTPPE